MTIVTRSVGPQEKALLTIGKIEGGQARNIIADKVVMNGTVRTFKDSVHEHVKRRIKNILKGMEKVSEVHCEFTEVMHYPVLSNPRHLVDLVLSLAERTASWSWTRSWRRRIFPFISGMCRGFSFLLGVGGKNYGEPLPAPASISTRRTLGGIEIYRRIIGLE